MINEKISGKQAVSIMILFAMGSSIVTGGSLKAEQDSWLSIIIGAVMSIPIVLIYARINKLEPDKDLFDLSYMVLGKLGGAIVTFLFSAYAIILGILVIRNFTEYIHVVSFPETPQIVVAISIGLIMYFTVKKGIEVLGRGNVFIMPIAMFVVILLILSSTQNMDLDNIKPILYDNLKPVLAGAYSVLVFPFAETVLFITVFSSVDTKENPAKLYVKAILFSGLLLFALVLGNTLVLGFPLVKSLYFPTYTNAGIIEVGKFFSRVEVLVSGNFIVFGLVKATVCLYVGCRGIAKLFNISDHKKVAAPISLLMMISSVYIFKNTMQMFKAAEIYSYSAPFFQIVIPLLILISLQIKLKKQRTAEGQKGA
jgi:spore germination protein KB